MRRRASKNKGDLNQLAKSIVDAATSEAPESIPPKNPHAVALAKLGASKGGKARAESLSPKERSAVAKKGAQVRWTITKEQEHGTKAKKKAKKKRRKTSA